MEKAAQNLELILKYFADFSPGQLNQLDALYGLYKEQNEKVNVISRKDIDSLYEKHVLHSLSIAAITEFKPGSTILDIGTGGGFPGIPLAIFYPEVTFHLADSIAKKTRVVEEVAKAIGLTNVVVQNTRVEQLKTRYDYTLSRAVAPLKDLWKWSKPLLHKSPVQQPGTNSKGMLAPGLICLKGGDLSQEISESGTRPTVIEIYDIFPEELFKEKFLVYVPS